MDEIDLGGLEPLIASSPDVVQWRATRLQWSWAGQPGAGLQAITGGRRCRIKTRGR